MIAWGDTVYDATGIVTWDNTETVLYDSALPLSDSDALTKPPWEAEDWPVITNAPPFAFEIFPLDAEPVTVDVSVDRAKAVVVAIPATPTVADVETAFNAAGFPSVSVEVSEVTTGGVRRIKIVINGSSIERPNWAYPSQQGAFTVEMQDVGISGLFNNIWRPYRIQVVRPNGSLVREITLFSGGTWTAAANEAATLDFTMLTHNQVDAINELNDPHNRVRLYNSYGIPVGTFRKATTEYTRTDDGVMLKWNGLDTLAQLASEVVTGVALTGVTLKEAVETLLDLQENEYPIKLAQMNAECAKQLVDLSMTDTTILAALRELQAQLPADVAGYFYLDSNRGLKWTNEVGASTKTLYLGERLQGITKRTRHDDVITRLYAYGEGADAATRLSLLDAGLSQPYIEDAAQKAVYGTLSASVTESSITDADALLRFARRVLENRSEPQREYTINVLDLARLSSAIPAGRTWTPDLGTAWSEMYVGGLYHVVDADVGVDVNIRMKRVEHDLNDPVPTKVELDNKAYTLADILLMLGIKDKDLPADITSDAVTNGGVEGGDLQTGDGHVYASDAEPQPPAAPGEPGDPGTSGDYARADHAHPAQEVPAASDAEPQPPAAPGAPGDPGTSGDYARADHQHPAQAVPVASDDDPLDIGITDHGTSEDFSRADHVHALVIEHVSTLPAIPTDGWNWVIWDAPSGDGQIWTATAGMTAWTPLQKWTDKLGDVV